MKTNLQQQAKAKRELPKRAVGAAGSAAGRVVSEAEAVRREVAQAELRGAFLQTFGTPFGAKVLADLEARFGWRDGVELPSYRVGAGAADVAFVEGSKEVVRYILRQAAQPDAVAL